MSSSQAAVLEPLVDTHAHLHFNQYDEDRAEVLAAAWETGLTHIVLVGTNLATSYEVLELAASDDRLLAALGVHPHDAGEVTSKELQELETLLREREVIAVGECGLDYHYRGIDRQRQQEVFETQLGWAKDLGLPLVIHNRDAHADTRRLMSGKVEHGGVMHCFSGDLEFANWSIDQGLYLGIGGVVTFQNAPTLQAVVSRVDLDRIVLETDCPFLSPHPYRGERNEPARVLDVAHKIAELQQLDPQDVARVTTRNARQLFGLGG